MLEYLLILSCYTKASSNHPSQPAWCLLYLFQLEHTGIIPDAGSTVCHLFI